MLNITGVFKTVGTCMMNLLKAGKIKNLVFGTPLFISKKLKPDEIKLLSKKIPGFLAKEMELYDSVYKPVMLKDGRMKIFCRHKDEFYRYLFSPGDKMKLVKKSIIGPKEISTELSKGFRPGFSDVGVGCTHKIKGRHLVDKYSYADTIRRTYENNHSTTNKIREIIHFRKGKDDKWMNGYQEVIETPLFVDKGIRPASQRHIGGIFTYDTPQTLQQVASVCNMHKIPEKVKSVIPAFSHGPYSIAKYDSFHRI